MTDNKDLQNNPRYRALLVRISNHESMKHVWKNQKQWQLNYDLMLEAKRKMEQDHDMEMD